MKYKKIIGLGLLLLIGYFVVNALMDNVLKGGDLSPSGTSKEDSLKNRSLPREENKKNLDIGLYYSIQQVKYEKKATEFENKYLQTGDEKFKAISRQYLDSAHLCAAKLQAAAGIK